MADNVHALRTAETRPHLRLIPTEGSPLREWSDEALMLEHAKGDEEAFGELVRRHQGPILNYIFRMTQNRQTADELTQEVFMALVKNAQRYQPTAKFTTYLYTIASNLVSKEWQRRKRRPLLLSLSARLGWGDGQEDDSAPIDNVRDSRADIGEAFERNEISSAVNEALSNLPAHQREAFVLRRFRDLSYEEIADITQVPVGTAKSRVVRAERALRPHLERFREYL